MPTDGRIVFISCGQSTEAERELGRALASLVSEYMPGVEGYFAQNETSLDALSRNVLSALNRCVGFVAVMHPRGNVTGGDSVHVRGSVWVEQEIAIASFLTQVQNKSIPVAVFIHESIAREGLRQLLQLNDMFNDDAEVLEKFRATLSRGNFNASAAVAMNISDPYQIERNNDMDYFSSTFPFPDTTGRFTLKTAPSRYDSATISRESIREVMAQLQARYNGYGVPLHRRCEVSAFAAQDGESGGVECNSQSDFRKQLRDARRLHRSGLYSLITLFPEDFDDTGLLEIGANRTLGFKHLVIRATLLTLLARNSARTTLARRPSEALFVELGIAGCAGRHIADDTNAETFVTIDSTRPCRESRIARRYEGTLGAYERELGAFATDFILEVCDLFNVTSISRQDVLDYQRRLVGAMEPIAFPA